MTTRTLVQVLADQAERINMLRRHNALISPDTLEDFRAEVARAAEPFTRFIVEEDAILYSEKSQRWLRARFAAWEETQMAKRVGRKRYYLLCALPRKPNEDAAYAAGKKEAEHAA